MKPNESRSFWNFQTASEYEKALAVSKDSVKILEDDIQTLKTMTTNQPPSPDGEIPFLPFGIDATQVFHAHVKYIDFKNGRGVMFLSQLNIEPSLVNNQGLFYAFQGVTNDGLYYVSARFPVAVSFLPASYDPGTFEGYTLPVYFYGENSESNETKYKTYLTKITRKLEKLPPNEFEPHLTQFEELIRSLRVKAL